ncbi:MAG: TonB-dependent receptor [Deltaproteobacteria bacterium]|nr:TonB-dependent receptor [Deltaproteobacteria bacterium]
MRLTMRFAVLFSLLLSLLVSRLVTPSAAEDVKLKEVVVTATRAEEASENIPSSITVITEEDIKNSTAATVQDVLEDAGGIIVRDLYGTGAQSTVDARGFGRGLNTLVLVDGRRVNAIDLSGVDWNLIPLENIERIEIVRGSGTVLYGDNSTSGVINIITKRGRAARPRLEAEARVESFNGSSELFSMNGTTETFGYHLLAKNRATDGYRANSEFKGQDLGAGVSFNPTAYVSLDVSGGYHTDHQGYPGGLTEAELKSDRRQTVHPDDGADYDQYYYDIAAGFSPNKWYDVGLTYDFNSRRFDSDLIGSFFGSPYSFNTVRDTDTDEVKLKMTGRHDVLNRKNLMVAGVDLYRSMVDNSTFYSTVGYENRTVSGIEKKEAGLYVNDDFSLSDRTTLNAGWRLSSAEFKDSVASVDTFGSSAGKGKKRFKEDAIKAGVNYRHTDGGKVFAGFSTGFRLPTTDELFAFDGTITMLKPEKSLTYEAGVVHPLRENLTMNLTVYDTRVKDELFWNPTSGFFGANENIKETLHRGAEAGFSARITPRLKLEGNWAYTRATFASGPYDGKTIPLVPKQTMNLSAKASLTDKLLLSVNAGRVGKRFIENDVTNAQKMLGGHTTVDGRLSYVYKFLTAYLGVNNLFNEKYSEYAVIGSTGTKNFYPAPERWWYGGIKAEF